MRDERFPGLHFLSAEEVPAIVLPGNSSEEIVRRFDKWSAATAARPALRSCRQFEWPSLKAWVPGTLEWRFRTWLKRRVFVVSE